MTSFVSTQLTGQRATVTLTRSDLHNAFNDLMIAELQGTFEALGQDDKIRVIVLAAEGKSFCAGADLNWMRSMLDYSFDENVEDAMKLARMLQTIQECPKPVIGRIHGAAFGGGVGLTSVCDMAVATQNATFSLSEVKLGLLPAVISPFVLQKIPAAQARRYFLTAERFSAQTAQVLGLVSEVVADEPALDAAIDKLVDALLQNGPEAVSLCKELVFAVDGLDLPEAMDLTTRMIAERRISDEGQDGMKSFLEKRSPRWLESSAGVS